VVIYAEKLQNSNVKEMVEGISNADTWRFSCPNFLKPDSTFLFPGEGKVQRKFKGARGLNLP
jgi:hypothetical protein